MRLLHPRSTAARLALAPLTLALGACATSGVRGPADAGIATPAQWQNKPANAPAGPLDTAALSDWWTRFNDPILTQLVHGALADSPDMKSALSRIEQARARGGIQRSALWPSVNASARTSGSRTRNRETGNTYNSGGASAGIDAGWEIDLFGQQRLAVKSAEADVMASVENFRAAQVSLAAEVALTYVDLRAAEAQLTDVQEGLRIREETTQLVQWQQQAGSADALQAQQAITTLEQTRASIPQYQLQVTQARNALAVLVGKAPGALDALLSQPRSVPSAPTWIAIGIPAETLGQRPDVRSAADTVRSAVALSRAAQLQRLPSLNLSGSIGVDALNAGKLLDPATVVASIAASIGAPIFDAGRIHNNAIVQEEAAKQALYRYESTLLQAMSDVENALTAIQRTDERLQTLGRAVAAAQQALDYANLEYKSGQVDLLNVLDAQRTLLSLQQQQTSTIADQATAEIQLYKALGGGWSPEPSLARQ